MQYVVRKIIYTDRQWFINIQNENIKKIFKESHLTVDKNCAILVGFTLMVFVKSEYKMPMAMLV